MKRWEGEFEGWSWSLEVEHDRFSTDEPFVVSVGAMDEDEDGKSETLLCLSPIQAREVAAALLVYANFAEEANAKDPSSAGPSGSIVAVERRRATTEPEGEALPNPSPS